MLTTEQKKIRRGYVCASEIANRLQGKKQSSEPAEKTFLNQRFDQLDVSKIGLEEVRKCMTSDAPLSVIFLCGSILEGILLSVASRNPESFNKSKSSPKNKEGEAKQFSDWSLAQFIDTAHECDYLKLDVKKFGHELRDFRNYIHPSQQACSNFQPTKHTAEICFQVLKAAIADLSGDRK